MNDIAVFGSSSSAGKSTITMLLLRILFSHGYTALPFKAQNFSNNSTVADDNSEIAYAQYFQAKSIDLKTNYNMNPLLIKSGKSSHIHIVNKGKFFAELTPKAYYKNIDIFKDSIVKSYSKLKETGLVICEGAGSPTELNFLHKDLANIFIAQNFQPKIIFVADIERGGVFASIYGTKELLKKIGLEISGIIINKFRGDINFFKEGIDIIENEFKIPVLGVLPYLNLNIGFEDSLNINCYKQNKNPIIRVGVIKYPYISNFYDIEPLVLDKEVQVDFLNDLNQAFMYDLIVLPGSRQTIKDLLWVKKQRYNILKQKKILAICGGFEMIFNNIFDGFESKIKHISGLNFIDEKIVFDKDKILNRGKYKLGNFEVEGFEMHYGKSEYLYYEDENIFGTFVHEALANDELRNYLLRKVNKSYVGYNYKEAYKNHLDTFIKNAVKSFNVDKFFGIL